MTDTAPDPLVPDGWELRPNRSAMLHVDGRRFTLKPPTFGELRVISEAIEGASDSIVSLAHDLDARKAEVREAGERGDLAAAEASAQDRKLGREFNRHVEDMWWEVLGTVFEVLGSARLPVEDDLPAWLRTSASEQIAALVGHWKAAPNPRGVRS